MRNTQGYSEQYREVVREDKVKIEGKLKAPDYSFRIGGVRKFFVEAKKPSVNIKEDTEPAFQTRRYAYTAKLPLSILTDFEEIAVYDTRIKPAKTDKASTARVFYCTFDKLLQPVTSKEYETNFDFLYNTFGKDAILKGSFDKYVKENKNKKGTSEVDKELLKLIEGWRNELARIIALRNKDIDLFNLNYAVQKIIDRLIFLRITEDRKMEQYGLLKKAGTHKDVYQALVDIFIKSDNKYNSGLFKIEDWLNQLSIDDKALTAIINEMYYPDCPYEFSVMPIEILGHVYEQFLGKTIRLTASHQAKVEEKPEVRKAGGVYYTPQYIVAYIVENTVGEKLKKQKPETITSLTILDPACGSGSFLVGAYDYLLKWHLEYYTKSKTGKENALKTGTIYQVDDTTYYLSTSEKKQILINNIYGVDIDSQAVEVTKLSLLLKLLEDENVESEGELFKTTDTLKLPNLSSNIKCGNSLIGSDFYTDKDLSLFGNDEMRQINVFDWDKEFVGVFENGGFDVVVGNPPYVRSSLLEENTKKYFSKTYTSSIKQYDIYVLFIEKGIELLKNQGYSSYIVSNKFLVADYGYEIRKFILNHVEFTKAIDVSNDNVFKQASVYPYIIVFHKENDLKIRNNNDISFSNNFTEKNKFSFVKKKQKDFTINSDYIFDFDTIGNEWIIKIDNNIPLGNIVNITRGFRPPPDNLKEVNANEKYLIGKDIKTSYYFKWSDNFVNYRKDKIPESKPIKIFKNEKVLFRDIGLKFNGVYDNEGYLCLKTIYFLYLKESESECSLKYILGILNSKLINKYFLLKYSIMHISGGYLRFRKQFVENIPIREINFQNQSDKRIHDNVCNLVNQIIDTKKVYFTSKSDNDKKVYQQKIDLLDSQIDSLVYELYGLTEDEIKVIEGNV